jgi:uncharacterized membrane protein
MVTSMFLMDIPTSILIAMYILIAMSTLITSPAHPTTPRLVIMPVTIPLVGTIRSLTGITRRTMDTIRLTLIAMFIHIINSTYNLMLITLPMQRSITLVEQAEPEAQEALGGPEEQVVLGAQVAQVAQVVLGAQVAQEVPELQAQVE